MREAEKINRMIAPVRERFLALEKRMSDPTFPQDPDYAKAAKEHNDLSGILDKYENWKKLRSDLDHTLELSRSQDTEMVELALQEKENLEKEIQQIEESILEDLLPADPNDAKNILLEIRAGTGGEEAALFAQELARMYVKFAENQKFRVETIDLSFSDRNGYKEAVFLIEKKNSAHYAPFHFFKFERGVHRVQRVPITESGGRIHTSTVTVAVLPEAQEVDVEIRTEDLKVDTYRASGHGGQHLQKTDSAVRITHLPSGIIVQCQDERSQGRNREKAMTLLRAKLYEQAQSEQARQIASDRKSQVGSGERSEKIRTYNFPQDRITDHRIGVSVHNIQDVLDGNLDPLTDALLLHDRHERESHLEDFL